jgi:site-specific DNA-methyltransferase (adenine-specific)
MMAYLAMMAPRLVELRRVLKPTGSIYLHCDPTASHYLKLLMDAVFGPENFRNEVCWQRSTAKGHAFTRYPVAQDTLLYYSKGPEPEWHTQYLPHREEYIRSHYSNVEPDTGRRYTLGDCLNPNPDRPNLTYEWNGHVRVWSWAKDKMQKFHDEGRLVYTKSGTPRFKRYLDEMPGSAVTSVWTDIPPINSQAAERLGYPDAEARGAS